MPAPHEERITSIIASQLGLPAATLKPATDLRRDLGLDSETVFMVILALEEVYELVVPDSLIVSLSTIRDLIDLVSALRPSRKRPSMGQSGL